MKLYSILFTLCFLFIANSFAQDSVPAAVDDFIKANMDQRKIPGICIAVIKKGKPIIVRGYGFANLEHQVPVKPVTIFQSGSVGKQFTAMAVMLLVEEGKIGLDEKISKYLGDVPESWSNITVRNLLSHTSGMTDYPEDFDFRKDYTEDELLKRAKAIPVAFKPGEKWQYSNLGYVTLGIMIGKVTGKFYGDFLEERVFQPLGMTTARVISERDIVANRAAGYVLSNGELKNQNWVSPSINTTADGSLYFSMLDMIRWEEGLANGKLVNKESYRQMWTPVRLNDGSDQRYGFGWALKTINGNRVIEHGGAWQGFRSHIARYPDRNLTVIVFANLGNANVDRIANGIAARIDPTLDPKPVVDKNPQLSGEFRKALEEVLKGNFDKALFTSELVTALTDPQDRFLAYLKKSGAIKSFLLIETFASGVGPTYRYDVEFENITAVFEVARKDGKIVRFKLDPE